MKKVLFMPFLQISSGHHQVAHALEDWLKTIDPSIHCKRVDILTYAFGKVESVVSTIYLKWIQSFPHLYSWVYKKSAYENTTKQRFRLYELLFQWAMIKVLKEEKPDCIICTHALPSYLLSRLKRNEMLAVPVINAYTDYFINNIWGTKMIDFHLVPDDDFKQRLIQKGCLEENIYVTGIPIHPTFKRTDKRSIRNNQKLTFLITGGSLGVGAIDEILHNIPLNNRINYKVLCGKNKRLFQKIYSIRHPSIIPLAYIDSREEMDRLYEQVHGIITKPGGVTVSECLHKKIPIFIYHALPGQEEMNLHYLKEKGLVFHFEDWKDGQSIEKQLIDFLFSQRYMNQYKQCIDNYHERISTDLSMFFHRVLNR
ncbi:UDP-glucuronosyltransferase [Bacillus sp. FJAT-47783]|uniref:MGDG synthase family glycosyltransferase n=1 Tax=Bacillus sp. FJAT-47783 TaxID=2922712 RepID=UPI001FAB5319|nr:UDP-glucuronosyltransferase [Bacillus sp. FJAT-47783]